MAGVGSRDTAGPWQKTLLIVEDEVVMRNALRTFLQQAYPQWMIIEAESGARALTACAVYRPGVVLMDIRLPDIDGIALTPRIKALLPDTCVIFVSYLHGGTHVERAFGAGGCAYVVKDRLFTDLLPAIAAAAAASLRFPG